MTVIQKMRIKLSFRLTGEENTAKKIIFTDEKNFYVNPPVNNQNDRVWARGEEERDLSRPAVD